MISFRKAVGISETCPVKTQGRCLRSIHNFTIQSRYRPPGACLHIRPRNARGDQMHAPLGESKRAVGAAARAHRPAGAAGAPSAGLHVRGLPCQRRLHSGA